MQQNDGPLPVGCAEPLLWEVSQKCSAGRHKSEVIRVMLLQCSPNLVQFVHDTEPESDDVYRVTTVRIHWRDSGHHARQGSPHLKGGLRWSHSLYAWCMDSVVHSTRVAVVH